MGYSYSLVANSGNAGYWDLVLVSPATNITAVGKITSAQAKGDGMHLRVEVPDGYLSDVAFKSAIFIAGELVDMVLAGELELLLFLNKLPIPLTPLLIRDIV